MKFYKYFGIKILLGSMAVLVSPVILSACAPRGESEGEITGKVWVLNSLNGSPPLAGTFVSAEFRTDGIVSGTGGCNTYSGQYNVTGNQIQFTTPMASTMMACDPPVMDQESAYFQALAAAKSFSIQGDQLTLKDEGNSVVASFTAQSQDLVGTEWLVTGYNNGKQAVVSPTLGSELTAIFGADGKISGSAGCNNFNGPFQVDGDKIRIGPLGSTKMMCSDPEGVMDQEAQYLAALQSATTYQLQDNRLDLRTADDAMAANFIRK